MAGHKKLSSIDPATKDRGHQDILVGLDDE